jgi:hypothetical protein
MDNSLKAQITDWSNAVIALLKQKMRAEEVHLICSSGLPWYQSSSDSWLSESWWIETAKQIYHKHSANLDRWLIDALEVLCQHFPSQYRDIARQRIDHWYTEQRAHDPENWLDLTCQVYPEHPMLREYLDDDVSWQIAAAHLGDSVQIQRIRDLFLADYQEQQVFWMTDDLVCDLVRWGGRKLLDCVVTSEELAQVHQRHRVKARQPDTMAFHNIEVPICNVEAAIYLDWQDVIEVLAQNSQYLENLNSFQILWWSLTNQHEITQQLVMRQNPETFQSPEFEDIYSHRVALAIAWQRSVMR